VYRGFRGVSDLTGYYENNTICWKGVTAASTKLEVAIRIANGEPLNVIFEIESIDGRNVSALSHSTNDLSEDVLFSPYSHFRVLEVKNRTIGECNYIYITMRQIQIPRQSKIIFWIDDNPINNIGWIHDLEQRGISVVTCTSTQVGL